MTRKVTGYYHMSAYRYRSKVHNVVVIAPELTAAIEAIQMFLRERGYRADDVIPHNFKRVRNISSNATVIVADFAIVPTPFV